jgi:zinc resistance-associated protein
MERSKLPLILLLALVLSLGLVSSSWARGGGWGCGPGAMNLTPAQAGQLFDLRQKFMNDTASLRKEMCIKRAEMRALWQAENPDQKQILAKQKEISALRDQLQEKAVDFKLQARKICPRGAFGMGPGRGLGMGRGPGGGPGSNL